MGLFSSLFGRKEPAPGPADLAVVGCDVHSHFIPGIDDGAQSLEQSLELLAAMRGLGYRKVITTPHSMADGYRNTPQVIREGLEQLRTAVHRAGLDIAVEAAAEYYLDHALVEQVEQGTALTFGDRLLLFELPFIGEPPMLKQVVFTMQTHGYRPVLAHPERYAFWHHDPGRYTELKERGVLFQLNIVALSGAYGPLVKQTAERLVDAGAYELLGSDCHNLNHVEAIRNTLTRPHLHQLIASGKLMNARL